MNITITLTEEQAQLYKESIVDILSSDTFSADRIGLWACGVLRIGVEDDTRWLLLEEAEDPKGERKAEAIDAWTFGEDLPKGYHYLNKEQAEKVVGIGILRHGVGFVNGETDANDLDVAIQLAILGEERYC